ncbi:histidine phosphatase superfamily [Lasiosphaeria miniovina]|uniref:Histidine phosphatase superfamily n=1 Tax=Lasiosphaeria miniovina TaxID=1954250 RepID=A0AA40DSM9_9PEZI|nr:histidine phosphatase superfamily [Lasiosphaeria miniovina]KAK0714035.1 histidine phosphatase superfamily [Lasiosphaeria miniovina]
MPPSVVLIRHAEALHNAAKEHMLAHPDDDQAVTGEGILDPGLSDLGRKQAAELGEHLKGGLLANRKVGLIVVSPMRRTLETCLIALGWLMDQGVRVEPDARWQELWDKPCDTGVSAAQLAAEFPQFDFSRLDPVYPDKTSAAGAAYRYSRAAVLARGRAALQDVRDCSGCADGELVLVVTHSGFLRRSVAGRWFANADYRVFDFAPPVAEGEEDESARVQLVEWDLTHEHGGLGRSSAEIVEWGDGLPER